MPVRTPAELFGPDAVSRTGAVRSPAAPLAVCLGACVLFGAAGGRAQEPEKPKSPPAPPVAGTAKPKSDPPPAPERWDELKLPPGAVIVVTKDGELARGVEGVFLSPEQYRQLTARLAQRQAAPAAPVIPSECHLQSQVSLRGPGGVARVRATFRVRTTEPGQVVFLGGRGARPASASLGEGKLPILLAGEEGLSVLVEEPGEHTVTVELQAKVVAKGAKGNELGYELSLPGSPITDLAQEAVPEVSSLRVGVREASPAPPGAAPGLRAPLQVERVDAQRLLPGAGGGPWPLGKAEYLEVSWEQPAPAAAGESPRTASAEVDVQVGETEVRATAVLRLTGSAREWKIWAPADAEVTAESGPAPGPGARAGVGEGASVGATTDFPFDEFPEIIRPADPREPVWTIRFEEPPASEVRVEVVTRVPRVANPQKGRGPFAIGPFAVEGVFPQPGEIRVTAPANLRVTCRPRGDVRRAEPPAGGAGEANGAPPARANRQAFRYQAPPADGKRRPVPPLQVEVQPIRGRVYTRTEHLLRLAEGGWYLRTEVRASPVRERVEMLELDVPAALQNIEASSPERELVEGVTAAGEAGPGHRRIQVRLAQARETDFVVRLEGFYPLKLTADEARFALPRPRGTFDERSEVAAVVPAGVNLRGSVRGSGAAGGWPSYPLEAARTSAAGGTEFRASLPGPPEEVRLSWRAQRPELPVAAEVDLVFRDGQAVLVHEVRFPAGPAVPRRLRLLGPRDLAGVRLLSPAGTIDRAAPGEWLVTLPASPEGNAPLRLSYAFALPPPPEGVPGPGAARRVEVPLLWVEAATRTETRVRVWGEESGGRILVPRPVGGDWHRQPTEVVPGRDALPLLVLVGGQAGRPLALELTEAEAGPVPRLWVDRGLVQAVAGEDGAQRYRARFRLRKWQAPSVELELPAPPALQGPEFFLGGKRVTGWEMLPEGAAGAAPGSDGSPAGAVGLWADAWLGPWRVFRVPVPPPHGSGPLTLEVRYRFDPPAEDGVLGRWARWRLPLVPPVLRGGALLGPVRWQVGLPEDWVALYPGSGLAFEQRLGWQRGLLRARAAWTPAELEQWFAEGPGGNGAAPAAAWGGAAATLVARQSGLGPFALVTVPHLVWLVGCSLLVLAGGLLLWRFPPGLFWAVALLAVAGAAVLAVGWPQAAAQVFCGAQVGLVVLAAVLGLRWVLHRRYRHRVAHVPGFSQRAPGSSLMTGSGRRPPRDVSTVDAAPPDPWASTEPAPSGSRS